jgi:hypothetical protein
MAAATKISLIPSELDLALYAGDGVTLVIGLNGSSGPLNVTGGIAAQIRQNRADDDTPTDFTADLTNGASGQVVLSLTGDQTQALSIDGQQFKGVWDVQWTPTGSEPVTVLQGSVTVDPDVTR